MKKLVIATSNANKVKEFKSFKELSDYEILSLKDLGFDQEIIEDGSTFAENAIIKAKTISSLYQCDVISDDSGLEIEALNNEPGVHTARFLGHDTSYEIKMDKVLEMMKDKKNRKARYVCAIAYARYGKDIQVFEDVMEGEIALEKSGSNGFGYDPIFYFPPFGCTVSCMSNEDKNENSHRGKAIRKFLRSIENE